MRSLLVFAMALSMLGGLSAAWAQVDGTVPARPVAAEGAADVRAGDAAGADLDPAMLRAEPVLRKPSGFWTSGRPAVGGSYRYRLLGIGTGVMLVTGAVMVWVVRRYPRRNAEG